MLISNRLGFCTAASPPPPRVRTCISVCQTSEVTFLSLHRTVQIFRHVTFHVHDYVNYSLVILLQLTCTCLHVSDIPVIVASPIINFSLFL
jgi:hypothetical protein